MYNYLFEFLEFHNFIQDLQFGFFQKHSTSSAPIYLKATREKNYTRKALIMGYLLTFKKHLILVIKTSFFQN